MMTTEQVATLIESGFDRSYYLASYHDVADSGVDPLLHFCAHGWREGRNPSSSFDTIYYLRVNHDVARADINPFLHYLHQGRAEGRRAKPILASARERLASSRSPAEATVRWSPPPAGPLLDVEAIDLAVTGARRLVVSVSHDDYAVNVGGVQNILGDECIELRRRGFGYLHLSPAWPIPALSQTQALAEFQFSVRLDGAKLGFASALTLRRAIDRWAGRRVSFRWVLHHLMGHSPEVLLALWKPSDAPAPLLWTHDFFAACPSYALMRNDIAYCGAPPANSGACRICVYGSERQRHIQRVRTFIESVQPVLAAPSQSAIELWERAVEVSAAAKMVIAPCDTALYARPRVRRADAPLRVAFLGARAYHKGWIVFQDLATQLSRDSRYQFFQLGLGSDSQLDCVRHVPVKVTADDRHAMVSAIAMHEIDVVVCWSLWPETFNFTLHEAIAGGAFVVARRDQGNVWPAATRHAPAASRAMDDERALHDYFRSGAVIADVEAAPSYRGALLPTMGSADILTLDTAEAAP